MYRGAEYTQIHICVSNWHQHKYYTVHYYQNYSIHTYSLSG